MLPLSPMRKLGLERLRNLSRQGWGMGKKGEGEEGVQASSYGRTKSPG